MFTPVDGERLLGRETKEMSTVLSTCSFTQYLTIMLYVRTLFIRYGALA